MSIAIGKISYQIKSITTKAKKEIKILVKNERFNNKKEPSPQPKTKVNIILRDNLL